MDKIIPFPGKIWIKLDKMEIEGLDLSGQNLVSEVGTVIKIGDNVPLLKEGYKVYFKAWGLDHIRIGNEDYYVGDIDSKAILGYEVQ